MRSITWIFCTIFCLLGILNMIYVHIVPGIIYLILSFVYLPKTNVLLQENFGFSFPSILKIIAGLVILWATLAVGDLFELFESWMLNH